MDFRSHKRPHRWVRLSFLRYAALSLGTWSPMLRENVVVLSSMLATKIRPLLCLETPGTTYSLMHHHHHPRKTYKVSWYCPNCRRHTTIKHNAAHFSVFLLLRHSPGSTEQNQKRQKKPMPDSGVESGILQNRSSTLSLSLRARHHHMQRRYALLCA